MCHIEGEGDALGKHLVDTVHHILSRTCLMAGSPLVEPSAPEFRAHKGRVGTELAQPTELVVDIGSRAEVHGPHQVIQSVLLEVGVPVALEQGGGLAPVLIPVFA